MMDAAQWVAIAMLFLAWATTNARGHTVSAIPPTPSLGPIVWAVVIKKGKMRFDRTITAPTEAEVVKILLSDGIDPASIGEITRA